MADEMSSREGSEPWSPGEGMTRASRLAANFRVGRGRWGPENVARFCATFLVRLLGCFVRPVGGFGGRPGVFWARWVGCFRPSVRLSVRPGALNHLPIMGPIIGRWFWGCWVGFCVVGWWLLASPVFVLPWLSVGWLALRDCRYLGTVLRERETDRDRDRAHKF